MHLLYIAMLCCLTFNRAYNNLFFERLSSFEDHTPKGGNIPLVHCRYSTVSCIFDNQVLERKLTVIVVVYLATSLANKDENKIKNANASYIVIILCSAI